MRATRAPTRSSARKRVRRRGRYPSCLCIRRHQRALRMPNSSPETMKGRHVEFRVLDIHLPEPIAVLHELHDDEVLEGTVVDVSGSGCEGPAFLVVEVNGLHQPCVLAMERILRAW